jgi:SAM-dependent methyltransferase
MSRLKSIEKAVKKTLIRLGLKQPIIPRIEISEGHLGGYVIGKPAPGTWCPEIWDWSIRELGIGSMLDVGCGLGYVMEYFEQQGIVVAGVDGSPSAIAKSIMPQHTVQHDYTLGKWLPKQPYDLIWSSEFLEHVEEAYIPHFMATFQAAKKYIFVTFAVPGQQGHHHVNLQYADYWIEKFRAIGFGYDEQLTKQARNLLPPSGMRGMQFRDKGLIFKKMQL